MAIESVVQQEHQDSQKHDNIYPPTLAAKPLTARHTKQIGIKYMPHIIPRQQTT